jgi:hypothetical protein
MRTFNFVRFKRTCLVLMLVMKSLSLENCYGERSTFASIVGYASTSRGGLLYQPPHIPHNSRASKALPSQQHNSSYAPPCNASSTPVPSQTPQARPDRIASNRIVSLPIPPPISSHLNLDLSQMLHLHIISARPSHAFANLALASSHTGRQGSSPSPFESINRHLPWVICPRSTGASIFSRSIYPPARSRSGFRI